jgi:hypothetical protein
MPVKKTHSHLPPARECKKELRVLYARRDSIDSLIESLRDYDRFRAQNIQVIAKRKLA